MSGPWETQPVKMASIRAIGLTCAIANGIFQLHLYWQASVVAGDQSPPVEE